MESVRQVDQQVADHKVDKNGELALNEREKKHRGKSQLWPR